MSHANGAGPGAAASERVGEFEGRSPSIKMEDRGLIEGRWVEKSGQRRRRCYRVTRKGREMLARQRSIWDSFFIALDRVARIRPV